MLSFRTLGTLDLTGADGASQVPGIVAQPKRLGVLLYLVLAAPGEWQRRDTLLGLLWPELDEARARNALSQALHHLRRALGTEVLPGQGPELVRADPEQLRCDATEFGDLLRAGRLAEALERYQGDLAPGFHVAEAPEFDRWLEGARRRLRDLAFEAAMTLASRKEAEGDLRGATALLDRAATLRPEDEGAARRAMQLLDRLGDRASALQVYERLAGRLQEELDVEPSPETQRLARTLRSAELAPEPRRRPATAVTEPVEPEVWTGAPIGAAAPPLTARRRLAMLGATMLLLLLVVLSGRRLWSDRGMAPATRALAIAPFRLAGADASLNYLREGMVDLLAAKLGAGAGPRALDPRAMLAAWRSAAHSETGDPTVEDALRLADQLGADRLVLGGVVGRADRVVINAAVRGTTDGAELARASVEGPVDSLPELVDRLAAKLLALDAGEGEQRLTGVTATTLSALRPYLEAQTAYRGGRYDLAVDRYRESLQADSGFTLAALGLAASGLWVPTAEADRRRALGLAWAGRARLGPADRAYLLGLAGPRYPAEPTARERLVAWEQAVQAAPDRPDVWYEYGDVLFHKGALLGIGGAWELARSAFQRAYRLDSTYAAASLHLYEMRVADGNVSGAREIADRYLASDSLGEHADFLRWRTAVAAGDDEVRRRLQREFPRWPVGSLWRLIGEAQLDGVGLDDAELAAAELRQRSSTRNEQHESLGYLAELALNRGRVKEAAALTDQMLELVAQRQIANALYGEGDSAAAAAEVPSLSLAAQRPLERDSVQRAFQLFDRCALAQWRLWHGDTTRTAETLRELHATNERNAPWWATGQITVCGALLEALHTVQWRAPDAAVRLATLDSLLRVGLEVGIREPGNLASARLHEILGDSRGALAALRRQEYHHRTGIPYLAARLRARGRLAAALGQREEAIRAYHHYLLLMAAPDPELRPRVDEVRRALASLEH